LNGSNHWRIPEIVSYYPDKNTNIPNFSIKKNVYGEKIQGRPLRVIGEQLKLFEQKKFEKGSIQKELFINKTFRWVEIVNDLEKIKKYVRKWADNNYSKELI